jgi:hypothetical protein
MSNILRVTTNVSDNPFIAKYVDIDFDTVKLEMIVQDLIKECSNRKYSASYQYDQHVEKVIDQSWDRSCGAIRPLYRALAYMLSQTIPKDSFWNDGDVAALRSLERKIAYLTPGFVDAKLYHERYGE